MIEPDRDVRGFQSVLCELGARLDLPGFINEDGSQKYADYADYITNHIRKPGIGPLAGWRMGEKGLQNGRGEANEAQLDAYIENGGFFVEHIPAGANYYKPILDSERLCITAANGVTIADGTGEVANVIIADIQADNGVIHVIDKVLLPGTRPACH